MAMNVLALGGVSGIRLAMGVCSTEVVRYAKACQCRLCSKTRSQGEA